VASWRYGLRDGIRIGDYAETVRGILGLRLLAMHGDVQLGRLQWRSPRTEVLG